MRPAGGGVLLDDGFRRCNSGLGLKCKRTLIQSILLTSTFYNFYNCGVLGLFSKPDLSRGFEVLLPATVYLRHKLPLIES